MGKIVIEIAVLPVGSSSASLGDYVAAVEKVLQHYPALKSELTPMSTVIEGEWEEVFRAVREMHEVPFRMGIKRVATRISIDERRDRDFSMATKIASVKMKLG